MLKYQVRTLNRGELRRRKSILEEGSFSPSTASSSSTQNTSSASSSSASGDEVFPSLSSPIFWKPQPSHHSGPGGSLRVRGRSASVSSLSSAGSSTEYPVEWGTVRVYTQTIRTDTDYKTIYVSTGTTASDVVRMVLSKFRINYKDSKLFYLSMELKTKRQGQEVENLLVLDPGAKPLELQACHPKEKSRFVLQSRPGFAVRIYDYCLSPESNYKSILVSRETTCAETVTLVLHSHRLPFPRENFVLVSVDPHSGYEYMLPPEASVVEVAEESGDVHQIHLRPFSRARLTQSRPPRRPPVHIGPLDPHLENCVKLTPAPGF